MYWARAKSILIFTLLALNIFLVANLYIYSTDRGASGESAANVEAILRSRNIEIACKIPKTDGASRRLNFISDGYDRTKLSKNLLGVNSNKPDDIMVGAVIKNGNKKLEILSTISFSYIDTDPEAAVDLTKVSKVEKYALDFLRRKELLPGSYIVDTYVKNADNSITFLIIEKYKDKLIYDNYLGITVTAKGVSEVTGSHRSIKKEENVKGTAMSALKVVLKNYMGNNARVIEGLDMGYYKDNGSSKKNMKASAEDPVWRVKVKGESQPRFFNVFTGDEIK